MAYLFNKNGTRYIIDKSRPKGDQWIRLGSMKDGVTGQLAKRALARYIHEDTYLRLDMADDLGVSFKDLSQMYREHSLKSSKRETTLKNEESLIRRTSDELGHHLVRHLTADHFNHWFKRAKLQPRTIYQYRNLLRNIFNYAVDKKYLRQPPKFFDKIEQPKLPKPIPRYVNIDDAWKVLGEMPETTQRPYLIMLYTGMRAIEVLRLKYRNINLHDRIIDLKPEQTKNKDADIVDISSELYPIIEKMMKYGHKPDDYLFPSPLGGHQRDIKSALRRASRKTGINITKNQFRHTFAVYLLKKTENIKLVQEKLRHRDLASTMVYAWVMRDEKKKAVEGLYS